MKTSMKVGLIAVLAVAALACVVAFVWRPSAPETVGVPGASRAASFEVLVEKPRMSRPLGGILPQSLEEKLEGGGERRFDHTSPGAELVTADPHRLELKADGWELVVETDDAGKITSATRVVYPTVLAERPMTLRCRPADGAAGYLRAAGSDALDGTFLVECAVCENVATGKVIKWPPAPLTISGRFAGLPRGGR